LLASCAPREFVKVGISDSQRDHDTAECWDYVLNSPEGQRKARNINIGQAASVAVVTGPVGLGGFLLIKAATRNKDPKEKSVNVILHQDCMRQKGYTMQKKS
jgi:hypothetical protein